MLKMPCASRPGDTVMRSDWPSVGDANFGICSSPAIGVAGAESQGLEGRRGNCTYPMRWIVALSLLLGAASVFAQVETGEKNATAEDIGRVAIVAAAGFNADQTTSVESVAVGVPILFAEIVLTSADR